MTQGTHFAGNTSLLRGGGASLPLLSFHRALSDLGPTHARKHHLTREVRRLSMENTATAAADRQSEKKIIFSASPWEPQMGYSRGVRIGNQVFIAGTVAADGEGNAVGHDAFAQTEFIIEKIQTSLRRLGAELEDVVSTTTHLTDFAHFDDYARAFQKYFGHITPVNTTVAVALVKPEFLVEITATAILPGTAES
ncbi:RidA family protein [Nonomuraea sp. NPDC049725]|uniref:RidA family protein n=2 Tax=Nonomuraea TaxID=83681 RepID=UPI0034281334